MYNINITPAATAYMNSINITPAATAGGNRFAGQKPGHEPRKRSTFVVTATSTSTKRCTLGETLEDVTPNFNHLHYQSQPQEGPKLVLTRVSADNQTKPPTQFI